MRFLHLADLHLGKQLGDLSLLEDQENILQQILSAVEREKVDAVLIAGDIYQRSSPQAEAMALFDSFVSQLVRAGKKVFAISGNHDSALRISYFSSLVRKTGVYMTDVFNGEVQKVTLNDSDGELNVWMMPFLRPFQVKRALPDEKIVTYQDAVSAVIRNMDVDVKKRNVLLCHQFVAGSDISGSEEVSVGGLDQIDASVFDGFDYVALGHIHKAQKVSRDTMRYAGAPLKYSFSEANHKKSLTIVDMEEKGEVRIHTVPLNPLRDVRLIEGMLNEVMNLPYSEDYVWITIHDELPPPDAKITLTCTFPNMLKFSVVNSRTKYDLDVLATESMEKKSVVDLFCDFYRKQNNDQYPSEMHQKILNRVLKKLEENENETH